MSRDRLLIVGCSLCVTSQIDVTLNVMFIFFLDTHEHPTINDIDILKILYTSHMNI